MSDHLRDFYDLLGITRDASPEEIRRAFFESAQRLHPDKNKAAGETELFLDVKQAYETLSNPNLRAEYDATLPTDETPSLPYQYKFMFSRSSLVRLEEPQMLYFFMDLGVAPEARSSTSPPLNVSLVIYCSTSMKGAKMDTVKSTVIQVLRHLRPQDILSIVAFSDRAEVIIPAAFQQERSRMESQILRIQPSGATEIFQGLEAGGKEILRSIDSKRLHHLVLLTDGQTYGDEEQCLELSSNLAEKGIGISAMGIGGEWNDSFLDALASRTGGSAYHLAEPQDIKRLLLEKFNALAQTFAEEITLELKPVEGVELSRVFRIQPDQAPIAFDEGKLHLGSILQDTATRVIFEYMIEPKAVKSDTLMFMDGILKVSIASLPLPVPPLRMRLQRPVLETAGLDSPPVEIQQALSRLMLYQMQERAREEIHKGNIAKATQQLQRLASNLLSQGEKSLAQTIMFEVDSLERRETLSEQGSKKLKYGTRALILAPPKKELVQ